jgi:phosphoglycerol transferase
VAVGSASKTKTVGNNILQSTNNSSIENRASWLDRPALALITVTALILAYILFRSLGIEPVVMSDEQRFNTYSRILNPSEAVVPSYLFYAIFHITGKCGSGFLECGRLLNVIFLSLSSIPIYLISRRYLSKKTSIFVTLMAMLAPFGYYSTYFMPEILYYFLFLTTAWVVVSESHYKNRWLQSCLSGALLGLLSLVKPHAFFLIPAYIIFRIYSHVVSQRQYRWLTLGTLILFAIATMIVVRFALGYWIAGPSGANLIGSMYGDVVNKTSAPNHWQTLVAIAHVAKGHAYGLLVLFAMPLVTGLILLLQRSNAGTTSPAKDIIFLSAAVLITMLAITAAYTVQVNGMNRFESVDRLHMRYYFFLFPLFASVGAFFTNREDFRLNIWQKAVAILVFIATLYAGFFGLSGYTPYPVDAPDLWAITTTPSVLHCFTLLQAFALLLLTVRASLASRFFCYVIVPAIIVQAAFAFPVFFEQYRTPGAADQAGVFYDMTIGSNDPVVVSGEDDSEVTRTIFHLNNRNIQKQLWPKDKVLTASEIPTNTRWIISLSGNPLDPALQGTLYFDTPGYKIWHVGTSAYDVDFSASGWPGVESVTGLSHQEAFGRWSDSKRVVVRFTRDIPADVTLSLSAAAYAANVGQNFQIAIGNQVHQMVFGETQKTIEIKFDEIPTHTREVDITVPHPISPKEVGLSADTRTLGIALSHLTLTPSASQ